MPPRVRAGVLAGDLDEVQLLSMVAAHPENAPKILRLLDRDRDAGGDPVTDEMLEGYVPVQEREGLAGALADLQTLGFHVADD